MAQPSPHILPGLKTFKIIVLLVDDQVIIAEAVRRMLESEQDIELHYCSDPSQAILKANEIHPTVILQDLVMPDIDGLLLVRYFRANPETKEVPLIVLSTKEDPKIKAEAFALGANDYIVKLPDKVELVARIRYHSSGYIRLLERNEAYEKLEEKQKIINNELMEAAEYVRTLLPPPIENNGEKQGVIANWKFIPSTQLGGDAFGYHWLDQENFAMYLLDVCGHGVGAALLSISVMNVLRSQSLPHTDFHNPSEVLSSLNQAFPMEDHNNMFFTIWYGVFNKNKRQITYSSGGHPPAILFTGGSETKGVHKELRTEGLVIGAMSDAQFVSDTVKLDKYGKLFIFSDGVYEITKQDGSFLQLDEFVDVLEQHPKYGEGELNRILAFSQTLNGEGPFADDFSIVEIDF